MAAPQLWTSNQYPKEFALQAPTPFICAKNKDLIYFVSWNNDKKQSNGVLVFDASTQQMKRVQAYPKNTSIYNGHSYCYHPQTPKIFIWEPHDQKVIIYDIASKQWNEHPINVKIGMCASLICVDDTIHVCGGNANEHHLMYHIKDKTITKGVQICKHKLEDAQCVHIPNTSTVFVIGGQHGDVLKGYKYSASMYCVSYESGPAASSICGKYTMPKPLSKVAVLFVHPFILMFGGKSTDGDLQDNVYSFDIDKHEWRESRIKIPSAGPYHAALLNDQKTIHLFDRTSSPNHFTISLNALLNCQWDRLDVEHESKEARNERNAEKTLSEEQNGGAAEEETEEKETLLASNEKKHQTPSREQITESDCDLLWKALRNLQDENKAIKLELSAMQTGFAASKLEVSALKRRVSVLEEDRKDEEEKADEEERVDELLLFLTDAKYAVNLAEHYEKFAEEEVTQFDLLMALNTQDLIDMNITKKGHQLRILRGVDVLKAQKQLRAAADAGQDDDDQQEIAAPAAYGADAEMVEGPNVVNTHRK